MRTFLMCTSIYIVYVGREWFQDDLNIAEF